MKIHSMSCYSNQEANGTWDVRSTLNMIVDSVHDVGVFQRAWQAFVESLSAPVAQAPVATVAAPPAPVVVEPAPQAEEVVVYATPSPSLYFRMSVPDPIVHIENNTAAAPPVEAATPAPEPKKRGRKKKEEVVAADSPASAPTVEEDDAEDVAPPTTLRSNLGVGTVKVKDMQFACAYSQTGVLVTCRVVMSEEQLQRLGVTNAKTRAFTGTGDTKRDAASFVAEEISDFLEMAAWTQAKEAGARMPQLAPANLDAEVQVRGSAVLVEEPAPTPMPEPVQPELTAADNPLIPPEVLRLMLESRKLTDSTVRSEVVSLWCKHLYANGVTSAEAIYAHMVKHQSRLTMFEKKPIGSSAPRLIETLIEGYKAPPAAKRTTFKPESMDVSSLPGDEIEDSDEYVMPFG